MRLCAEAAKTPYEFDVRPAIRFILVQSPDVSELIILCHHIICDGMSLAYLARDLLVHLGNPAREVDVSPAPAPIDLDNLPDPDVLAEEIIENLEAGVESFKQIMESLNEQ